jgi:hypothetical protein
MPAQDDDKLDREVTIAIALEETSLKLKTKSRAVAAFDRVFGAIFDIPAAYMEGVASKKRLHDEIYAQLKKAQAASAVAQISEDAVAGNMLIEKILTNEARKQSNLSGVAVEAVEAMKALPAPEEEPNVDEDDTVHDMLSDDWLNMFQRYAEDASSEQLQQLWGQVLAGEIRKKGSFSRQTLRFVAELDGETAQNCEWIAEYVIGNWIPKGKDWNTGEYLLRLVDLQRMGLIEGVSGLGPNNSFKINEDGTFMMTSGTKGLVIKGEPGRECSLDTFLVTRLGKEVFSLLPPDREGKALRRAADALDKIGLTTIYLAALIHGGWLEGLAGVA